MGAGCPYNDQMATRIRSRAAIAGPLRFMVKPKSPLPRDGTMVSYAFDQHQLSPGPSVIRQRPRCPTCAADLVLLGSS